MKCGLWLLSDLRQGLVKRPALPLSYRAADGGPGGNRTRDLVIKCDVVSPAFAGLEGGMVENRDKIWKIRITALPLSYRAVDGGPGRIRTGDKCNLPGIRGERKPSQRQGEVRRCRNCGLTMESHRHPP